MALQIEKHNEEGKKVSQKLSCCIEVVLMLLRLKSGLSAEQHSTLRNFFTSNIDVDSETGWEESSLASIKYLLKNSLNQEKS